MNKENPVKKTAIFLTTLFLALALSYSGAHAKKNSTHKEIHMLAYKWGYNPDSIVVRKGAHITLYITVLEHKHGSSEGIPTKTEFHHGFSILGYNIATTLPIGKTKIEFIADQAGKFPFICTIWCGMSIDGMKGHHTMNGELVVYDGENPPDGYTETPDGYHYSQKGCDDKHEVKNHQH